MKPGVARQSVKELLASEGDLLSVARTYLQSSLRQPDVLKIAQYALLVDPIQRGVVDVLDRMPAPGESRLETGNNVGRSLIEAVARRIRDAPGLYELVEELATRRADRLVGGHAQMVAPISHTLRSASMSAAHATLTAIEANTVVAARSVEDEEERAEVVRSSTHLALAQPMVHLEDHSIVNIMLRAHNGMAANGMVHPEALLRYDMGKVVLNKPIAKWHLSPTLTIGDVADRHADVGIGCPFSFASHELRVGYYQAVADLAAEAGEKT